jgi:hypothetical protein
MNILFDCKLRLFSSFFEHIFIILKFLFVVFLRNQPVIRLPIHIQKFVQTAQIWLQSSHDIDVEFILFLSFQLGVILLI